MFRVGVTRDFLKPDGNIGFGDIGLKHLESVSGVKWEFMPENTPELSARQIVLEGTVPVPAAARRLVSLLQKASPRNQSEQVRVKAN